MSPDWLMTRLAVVLLAVAGPIYFFLLMLFIPQMTPFADEGFNFLFHYIAAPIVFSVPWVGTIYYQRYRLANTIHIMDETITVVPLRWRIFYGANAAFILMVFILPLASPVIALIEGLIVAGHVFYLVGIGKLGGGKLAAVLGVLVALALCILPAIVMIEFFPMYLVLWETILQTWTGFWLNIAYGVAQCLVNALSFGAPVYFIYFGAREYDKGLYGEVYTKTPTHWIRLGEFIIFLVFVIMYLPPIPTPLGFIPFLNLSDLFNSYINWISLGIVVIMVLVKMLLKVKGDTTMGGISNIFVIGLFLIVELFFKTNLLLITSIIWLAFIIYAGLAAVSYLRASPRELY
ncbi:hypothetical protein EU527_08105 [Candidatus Thorarchaeota archaeon]|nr:MAG: hypothetical protein EU527_08105 [Candidatus Thorarchaeota archaeon]